MHIRHGKDKTPEHIPTPLRNFTRQLEKIVARLNLGTRPKVFLATDDPKVVAEVKAKWVESDEKNDYEYQFPVLVTFPVMWWIIFTPCLGAFF